MDTCCIDKRDSVELSKAINSMFSWYQHSTRCYVYLSDVTAPPRTPWKTAFQKSKWFTRGWTLQELLAPSSVEFFTIDGQRLGDKRSLSQVIHQATAITLRALGPSPLHFSDFSIEERMSWSAGRETKREEDAVYSVLGLFDVHMPPIYGEGKENAFDRLESEMQRKLALDSSRKRSAEEAFETCLLEERNARLRQSAGDKTQEHPVAMQNWWAEAIARNMGRPRVYANVAVLLLKWTDELDEFKTGEEVSNSSSKSGSTPVEDPPHECSGSSKKMKSHCSNTIAGEGARTCLPGAFPFRDRRCRTQLPKQTTTSDGSDCDHIR